MQKFRTYYQPPVMGAPVGRREDIASSYLTLCYGIDGPFSSMYYLPVKSGDSIATLNYQRLSI
jgi:hypothetical protein